jgi:hypothetical protein
MLPLAPLLAVLAFAAPVSSPSDSPAASSAKTAAHPQDEAAKLRAELIQKLLALATWCNDKELFLQRDNVWRSVLALDSENAGARQGLRYGRDVGGKWKDPAPREVKDRNAAALPEFGKKRSEAVGGYRDALLALLEKEQASAEKRAAALDEVLLVDPDDPVIHDQRGESRAGEKWVLTETVTGEARRAEIKQWIQKGRTGVPEAAKVPPTPADLALLPAWKASLDSDGVHLLSQMPDAEAKEWLTLAHASCALLEGACGKPMPPAQNFTAYLLVDPAEKDKLLTGLPSATDAVKKSWKDSSGFGIPGLSSAVIWDKDLKRRVDCFTRQLIASQLFQGFHIESRQGWAFEGFGLYFGSLLTGSRTNWFIGSVPGEPVGLRTKLFSQKTDWYGEAITILKSPSAPKLSELLGKELAAVKIEEMVVAQAFAAYLVEGLPKELPEILTHAGAGESTAAALEAVTKRPLAEIEKRFQRWLGERH